LNDFEANKRTILDYYTIHKGEKYFMNFLKPLADLTNLTEADFVDWGNADST
jgi:sulfite reductase (ferredoxin)